MWNPEFMALYKASSNLEGLIFKYIKDHLFAIPSNLEQFLKRTIVVHITVMFNLLFKYVNLSP